MFLKKARVYAVLGLVVSYLLIYGFLHGISVDIDDNFKEYIKTSAGEDPKPVIILDAGHGGEDGGCIAYDGKLEKEVNLSIMLSLKSMLEAFGYRVEATRTTDTAIYDMGVEGIAKQKKSDMENRLKLFNKYENSIAVSIHQNQFTNEKPHGAQMFYSETNPLSEDLAQILQKDFHDMLQPDNERKIKMSGDDLYLLYYAKSPSVMVECGFLSNKEEADKLQTEKYRRQVAFTIFCGINQFVSENYKI